MRKAKIKVAEIIRLIIAFTFLALSWGDPLMMLLGVYLIINDISYELEFTIE